MAWPELRNNPLSHDTAINNIGLLPMPAKYVPGSDCALDGTAGELLRAPHSPSLAKELRPTGFTSSGLFPPPIAGLSLTNSSRTSTRRRSNVFEVPLPK